MQLSRTFPYMRLKIEFFYKNNVKNHLEQFISHKYVNVFLFSNIHLNSLISVLNLNKVR